MPQLVLPVFPEGTTEIGPGLSFEKRDGSVTYFHGIFPVFSHEAKDTKSFRMITSQFYINGHVKQMDLVRAFGVTSVSVKRSVALYRARGPEGFFAPRKTRGASVLTSSVLAQAQGLLDEGVSPKEVAGSFDVKWDTFSKALRSGRLHAPVVQKKLKTAAPEATEA